MQTPLDLLVCPANVSEGRREAVVASIGRAAGRPGVHLLDVHTDPDHNRSVLTIAGRAGALVDEIPSAYKDIDQVMADQADLVEIRHTLHQVLNYKGT